MTSIRNFAPFASRARKIKSEDLSSQDAIILLMGATGSGKGTFVKMATGLDPAEGTTDRSNRSLGAIRVSWPELSESDICFLDTPAFNHEMSHQEIVAEITGLMNEIYRKGFKLEGLLYFHRISDPHTARTLMNNPQPFELYFRNKFDRIILTTTMWDEVDETTGNRRENEMKAHCRALIDRGLSVKRFRYNRASTFEILAPIIREVNTRNEDCLRTEITALKAKLEKDPAGRSLSPEIDQGLSQLRTSVQSIRNQLMQPSSGQGEIHRLTADYQRKHMRMQRSVDGMQRISFTMGEWFQRATRHLTWEPFIREMIGTTIEQGNGVFREEGPWNRPGHYDSWKEFEQWKEFEKWKEFKQWKDHEQWLKYRQWRRHRHGADEPQPVQAGRARTAVDTDRPADVREHRTSMFGSSSASSSGENQDEEYTVPRAATDVIGRQSMMVAPKRTDVSTGNRAASATSTVDRVRKQPSSEGGSRTLTTSDESGALSRSSMNIAVAPKGQTKGRQPTAPTMGGPASMEVSASGDSKSGGGRTASTSSGGRPVTSAPASSVPVAANTGPSKGYYGRPGNDEVSTSGPAVGSGTTGYTIGRGTTGTNVGSYVQNPTTAAMEESKQTVRVTGNSPSWPGEGSGRATTSGGQPMAIKDTVNPTSAIQTPPGSAGSSPSFRGQSTGGRRPSVSSVSGEQAAWGMGTIWERQTTGSSTSQARQPSVATSMTQTGSSGEANRSAWAQDKTEIRTEQGYGEQMKSVNSTTDSSSTSSKKREKDGHRLATGTAGREPAVGVTQGIEVPSAKNRDTYTTGGSTSYGGGSVPSRTSQWSSGGESGRSGQIAPSTSTSSVTSGVPTKGQPIAPSTTRADAPSVVLATDGGSGDLISGGAQNLMRTISRDRSATGALSSSYTAAPASQQEVARQESFLSQAERERQMRQREEDMRQKQERERQQPTARQTEGARAGQTGGSSSKPPAWSSLWPSRPS